MCRDNPDVLIYRQIIQGTKVSWLTRSHCRPILSKEQKVIPNIPELFGSSNPVICALYINMSTLNRYYIQAPVILDKLPEHYPVSDAIVKLIEDVLSRILGKSVSLALNNILS